MLHLFRKTNVIDINFKLSQNLSVSLRGNPCSEMECKSTRINLLSKIIFKKKLTVFTPSIPLFNLKMNIYLIIRYFIRAQNRFMFT